jgi:hypothetical protein
MVQSLRVAAQLVAAAIAYAVLGFVLYRMRATSDAAVWDSDLLVFFGPALVALAATTCLSWRACGSQYGAVMRLALSIVTGVLVTGLAAWAYAFVAFNRYGT